MNVITLLYHLFRGCRTFIFLLEIRSGSQPFGNLLIIRVNSSDQRNPWKVFMRNRRSYMHSEDLVVTKKKRVISLILLSAVCIKFPAMSLETLKVTHILGMTHRYSNPSR